MGGRHGLRVSLGPYLVTSLVPGVPVCLHSSITRTDLSRVGNDRTPAGHDFVLGIVCNVDEVHRAGQSYNLRRLIADIEIKRSVLRGHNIPERRGDLDDRLCAFVEDTRHTKGNIKLDGIRLGCDELDLRRPAEADPDIIGHENLGLAFLV